MQQTWKMYMEVETVVSDSKMYQLINFLMILYGNFWALAPFERIGICNGKENL